MDGGTVDFKTARAWELASCPGIIDGIRASGVASRMLADVCTAVRQTVEFVIGTGFAQPDEVLASYPRVLDKCDSLTFEDPPDPLAYLALHLPDRYCRVFQVLETLLIRGMLPLGRGGAQFSVVDIGAGPGPGIFAIRSFYAALSHVAQHTHVASVATLRMSAIVERSRGMSAVMHYFAEHLVGIEQGQYPRHPATDASSDPHPCATELAASTIPFSASHRDFENLDLRGEHTRGRLDLARELEDDLNIDPQRARKIAHEEPLTIPSAYAIALMTNFLTTTDALPKFHEAIRRLMAGALVPGGIVLVLGGASSKYAEIYEQLDRIAINSGLRVMGGFDEPIQAGIRPDELEAVKVVNRHIWATLATRANNVPEIERELRSMKAGDVFDESLQFRLPRFRVRVYRRGRWPGAES